MNALGRLGIHDQDFIDRNEGDDTMTTKDGRLRGCTVVPADFEPGTRSPTRLPTGWKESL